MSHFDIVKDSDGKTFLYLENRTKDEGGSIGNKPEDFDILRKLGEGAFGQVFKVRSKLNNEIYAMKK